jgi:hypothetical protein
MQPLKRIDRDTPIGTRVVVVTDDGLFTGKTTGGRRSRSSLPSLLRSTASAAGPAEST